MARIRSVDRGVWTETFKMNGAEHYLYIIQEGDVGPCKVGIARNPLWRRSDLQTGNFRELHLRHVFSAPDRRDVILAEAAVLSAFATSHLRGEWVSATPSELREFLNNGSF